MYNLGKLSINYFEYGLVAVRDGTFVLDSLFVLVSLSFFSSIEPTITKILKICFLYSFMFILFWFIRDSVIFLSPTITSPLGGQTNLFFNFSTINVTCGFFAFYSYLFLDSNNKKFIYFLFFLIFSLILLPKRMIYIWYISAFLYLIFIDKKNINFTFKLLSVFIVFYIIDLIGFFSIFKVKGINFFDFFKSHLLSTIPTFEINNIDDFFVGTQSTVSWRIDKWTMTISNVMATFNTFLFGLPFGVSLTDFYNTQGMQTREPHNLYITIFARTGLIGFILFSILHFKIIRILYKAYIKSLILRNKATNKLMILFMMYVLFIFGGGGISSSILSATYHSTQFYLFVGIWISIYFKLLKDENLSNT
ncbi:O-antigen ligase family protein [Candidatus Pelagibacter sp. Uisw_101]|uniref:O-antigen ligase family protein n=1 Tax=Candidatus Pelagibacter sp. Uisw_101 TaxID=3230982 RepID=UPI0039E8BD8F